MVRPQSAPDVVAELKALPLYPNARAVEFRRLPVDNSPTGGTQVWMVDSQGATTGGLVILRDYGEMSFEVQDKPRMVHDFYRGEFSKRGWRCSPAGVGGTPFDEVADCRISEEGPLRPRFTGFDGPDASPPWIKLDRPVSFRDAVISAHRWSQGTPTTNVTITYDYMSLR